MKFDMTHPCNNCPFRYDKVFPLAPGRAEEICSALIDQQQTFACHKTTRFDDDTGEAIKHTGEQHCAGALIMLEHMEQPNQMMRIAERLGFYDRTKLDMEAPVYSDDESMIDAIEELNS